METTHSSGSFINFNGGASVGWTSKLAPGVYDSIRFNVSIIVVNIKNIGNVSFALVGGGFETPLLGNERFGIIANHASSVDVYLGFSSTEIYALNGKLHANAHANAPCTGGGISGC
jgi:hypothetical protein